MTTELKLRDIGNSKGVILSSDILTALGMDSPGKRMTLTINKEKNTGLITVTDTVKPEKDNPFACLSPYNAIWNKDPRNAVEIAEELKSERHDIDR